MVDPEGANISYDEPDLGPSTPGSGGITATPGSASRRLDDLTGGIGIDGQRFVFKFPVL
jgi:hypothetical protein